MRMRTAATPAPGLGSPLPRLRRDWAHPCHACAGTGLAAATSAPGLVRLGGHRCSVTCRGTLRQVIETSNVAYEARDQAQNEINLLKVRPPARCNATTRATRSR